MKINRRAVMIGAFVSMASFGRAFARNTRWASPRNADGVTNLYKVGPNLYRSAQPSGIGFISLEKKFGIKTDINLRLIHENSDQLDGTRITLIKIPMIAGFITTGQFIAALKNIKEQTARGPVLVHCEHGADRTGAVFAMYRIIIQKWSKIDALDEMQNGGYNYHAIIVTTPLLFSDANIAAIKAALAKA